MLTLLHRTEFSEGTGDGALDGLLEHDPRKHALGLDPWVDRLFGQNHASNQNVRDGTAIQPDRALL